MALKKRRSPGVSGLKGGLLYSIGRSTEDADTARLEDLRKRIDRTISVLEDDSVVRVVLSDVPVLRVKSARRKNKEK